MDRDTQTRQAFQRYRDQRYFPALDGLRALCILGVIGSHMTDKSGWAGLSGGLGVNVFFVLSGYLITMLALREERTRGHLSLQAFYVRRTLRIFPLYYLALLVYCGLMFATNWGSTLRGNFADAVPYYLTYLQEIPYAFDVIAGDRPSPFGHAWSLGIEEKYYLVWPILAFGLWAWRPAARLRGTILLLVLFAATQSIGRMDVNVAAWHPEIILYPYSNILWGCLLAVLLEDERWFRRLLWLGTPAGTAIAMIAFVAAQVAYQPLSATFHEIVILHSLAATLLLASILTGGGLLTRALAVKPAVFLGRISYGMYLFHGLGISLAQKLIHPGGGIAMSLLALTLAVLATVLTAYVLAVLVERPCLRFGRRWSDAIVRRQSEPARKMSSAPSAAWARLRVRLPGFIR